MALKNPSLTNIYGKQAEQYLAFPRKHVVEKWDSRGQWHEEGGYGDITDPCGKESYKGDYLIRWNFGSGYRDFEITIIGSNQQQKN